MDEIPVTAYTVVKYDFIILISFFNKINVAYAQTKCRLIDIQIHKGQWD